MRRLQYVGGAEASGNSAAYNVSLTILVGGGCAQSEICYCCYRFVQTSNLILGCTAGYAEVADLYQNDTRFQPLRQLENMGGTPTRPLIVLVVVLRQMGLCGSGLGMLTKQTLDVLSTTAQVNNSAIQTVLQLPRLLPGRLLFLPDLVLARQMILLSPHRPVTVIRWISALIQTPPL